MYSKYKDLFIDFDDTLYDTYGNAVIALGELFRHFNLGRFFSSEEQFTSPYWKTNVELWDQYAHGQISRDYLMVERFRRPLAVAMPEPSAEFCLQVSDVFLDLCSQKSGVVPGAHALMEHLKARGYGLHLCSNGFHEVQYRKLRASNLLDFFDNVILSEDAGANKPSPDFFAFALRKSGANPDSTLMIGDNLSTDIRGAMNSGIDAMFFNRFPDHPADVHDVKYVVTSLDQIRQIL